MLLRAVDPGSHTSCCDNRRSSVPSLRSCGFPLAGVEPRGRTTKPRLRDYEGRQQKGPYSPSGVRNSCNKNGTQAHTIGLSRVPHPGPNRSLVTTKPPSHVGPSARGPYRVGVAVWVVATPL